MPEQTHVASVRFSQVNWQLLEDYAAAEGLSTQEFIRESALFRVIWLMAQEAGEDVGRRRASRELGRAMDRFFKNMRENWQLPDEH